MQVARAAAPVLIAHCSSVIAIRIILNGLRLGENQNPTLARHVCATSARTFWRYRPSTILVGISMHARAEMTQNLDPSHVASMSHGVAGTISEALKTNGNFCYQKCARNAWKSLVNLVYALDFAKNLMAGAGGIE